MNRPLTFIFKTSRIVCGEPFENTNRSDAVLRLLEELAQKMGDPVPVENDFQGIIPNVRHATRRHGFRTRFHLFDYDPMASCTLAGLHAEDNCTGGATSSRLESAISGSRRCNDDSARNSPCNVKRRGPCVSGKGMLASAEWLGSNRRWQGRTE